MELEAKNYQNEIASSRKQISVLNREKESLLSIKDLLTKEKELLERELRSSTEERYRLSDQVEVLVQLEFDSLHSL